MRKLLKPGTVKKFVILLLCISIQLNDLSAQDALLNTLIGNREERLEWWKDARYGLFIHWGPYSRLAGEWKSEQIDFLGEWIMQRAEIPVVEYRAAAKMFNPGEFDAGSWVKIAKSAGIKYIVITAKHCDGFAMYDSDVTDYNIKDWTEFSRDPINELAEACNKEGLKLGFYYSQNWDWDHPDALGLTNDWDYPDINAKQVERYYNEKCYPQVRELVKKYHPAIMWFDVPTDISREQSIELLKIVRGENPDIIINDRISHEHIDKTLDLGDYLTPEQFIPAENTASFETCMTLNNTWGFKKNDTNWKSAKNVVQNLILTASKGGNYLLNIGPDGNGNIPAQSVDILKEAGYWLEVNGESIYGSEKSPLGVIFYNQAYCTYKPGKLYIHLCELPDGDKLILGDINTKVKKIYFLSDKLKTPITFQHTSDKDLIIDFNRSEIPNEVFSELVTTMVIEIQGLPVKQNLPQIIDPHMTARFGPEFAEFSGNCRYDLNDRWDEHRGYEILEWSGDGSMQWPFRTIKNGIYEVYLKYGAVDINLGNELELTTSDISLKNKITDAPGRYGSSMIYMGKIELNEGITDRLKLSLITNNIQETINFRELILIPVR